MRTLDYDIVDSDSDNDGINGKYLQLLLPNH